MQITKYIVNIANYSHYIEYGDGYIVCRKRYRYNLDEMLSTHNCCAPIDKMQRFITNLIAVYKSLQSLGIKIAIDSSNLYFDEFPNFKMDLFSKTDN